jgi:type IV pilus assembly protein PilP
MRRWMRHGVWWLICCLGLPGCGPAVDEGVTAWLQAERQAAAPPLRPPPEHVRFVAPSYGVVGLDDPFAPERLAGGPRGARVPTVAAVADGVEGSAGRPGRPRQPLEAFALDRMRLLGSLSREGRWVALIKVEQQLYPVHVGDYLGPHQGRVHRITERGLELRERLRDASGHWTDRPVSLRLQEEPRP